jgi:hypothetical protein
VYTGARKKSARHGLVLRCFSPEAYSPCLVPLFLMVPLSHKLLMLRDSNKNKAVKKSLHLLKRKAGFSFYNVSVK